MLVWGLWTVRMDGDEKQTLSAVKTIYSKSLPHEHRTFHLTPQVCFTARARVCVMFKISCRCFRLGVEGKRGSFLLAVGNGGLVGAWLPPAPFLSQFWLLFSGSDAVSHTAERIHPSNFTQHGRFITSSALIQLPQVLMPSWPARTGPVQAEPDRNRTKPSSLIPRSWTCSNNGFSSDQKPGFLCLIPKERKGMFNLTLNR